MKECAIEGCGSGVLARGWCRKHYERWRKHGTTERVVANEHRCTECGQRWAAYKSGLCKPCKRRLDLGAKPFTGKCVHCGSDFTSKRRYAPESGRGMYCSTKCKSAARVADGRAASSALKHHYLSQYNLTLEQVDELRSAGCAICHAKQGQGRWGNLHIDHDHKTGRVRGALCSDCNHGIAKFKDDPALLAAAMEYLRRS